MVPAPKKSRPARSRPRKRCAWAAAEGMHDYHDLEWGVPVHDDDRLFEFLILEGAQAGLSWETILRKRANYRQAFDQFKPRKVARYGPEKIALLLNNPGIVRNRLKVNAAVTNAQRFLEVQKEFKTFDAFLWQFVGGQPRQNRIRELKDLPATTAESDAMSKELKRRGFKFVGSTICYALMQATGMVNDHEIGCFRRAECAALGKKRAKGS